MIRKVSLMCAGAVMGAAAVMAFDGEMGPSGVANAAADADTYRQLNLFGDIFERIRADYVEEPSDTDLIEAAVEGMLSSLDPHSSYLSPDSFQDMQVQTRGEFGGLGIEVTMEDGLVKVVAPIDDTPASRAGVMANDLITRIDGENVQGLSLSDAVDLMRGPVDTEITLSIVREGASEPIEVTLTRDIIRVQAVRSRIEDDIGYLRVTTFNEQTFEALKVAIDELEAEIPSDELKGFVLDLRNNPGGLLDQAISVSDAFLDRGEIVSTRGRHENETRRYTARAGDLVDGKPIIVLVNGGSASASEIVAGALQDHRRATVLGTRSFGKGSVQTIIPLGANGAIRLTTARYYTPAGTSIQAKGIAPDIEVEQVLPEELAEQFAEARGEASLRGHLTGDEGEEEVSGSRAYVPTDPEEDTQLNYAYDLLRGVQQHAAFPPNPNDTSVAN